MQRRYHVLTGPTASGKSGFLLEQAATRPLAVISADSRQIYRMMDIGTGKPTAAETAVLPHYGVDFLELGTKFSVYQYLILVARILRGLPDDGRQVWICGGTGLYIHALLAGLELGDPPREQLRRRLGEVMAQQGAAGVADSLQLSLLDPSNPMRVMRAAENACEDLRIAERIYSELGISEFLQSDNSEPGNAEFRRARDEIAAWQCAGIAVLDPGRDALHERIRRRVGLMFESGLPGEVQRIRDAGHGSVDEVANGIAYREAGMLLDGEVGMEEAIELSVIRTRQYAKRQRTYFRGRGWPFMDQGELADWFSSLS